MSDKNLYKLLSDCYGAIPNTAENYDLLMELGNALMNEGANLAKYISRRWKPIDEAPTDGTVIEAWEWNPSSEKWCHYDCFWGEYDEIYVVDEDNGWIADSWGYPVHPTHWRELPEPPEVNHE